MRIGFVPGVTHWWQKQRLAAKYFKMRLEGVIYPDVYALPLYFADKFDFIKDAEDIAPGRYDLIMSELQGSDGQLEYLESLAVAGDTPVAVIPGPPEILSRDLTQRKLLMVKRILSQARHVWAYCESVRSFCNGLIAEERARLIPWPFDLETTLRLGERGQQDPDRCRILLQVPMRFYGITQNHPFVLKGVLMDVCSQLPVEFRRRLSFHTFVYTREDRELYTASGFADGLPIHVESKTGYASFVRLMAEYHAVINLTVGSILGRITFLSAALNKPGIFSQNCDLNQKIYPNSGVEPLDTERLRDLLQELLTGLSIGRPSATFMPCKAAVAEVGDFNANVACMQELIAREATCAAL